jgi:hypothetical protein
VRKALLAMAVALAIVATTAVPADANPPPGDWTLVKRDQYRHYACKVKAKGGWRIRTATWHNNSDARADGIGVYVALARGSNRNLVAERESRNWEGGYIRTLLRGAEESDRLWMQGAYYGPAEPWSEGVPVRRLVRCASVA